MCAKYQDSNLKTVPWVQKVNFRQKNTKKVKEKNTFSPLTQKIIKISKNKIIPFLEFYATNLHAKFHESILVGVTCSDGTHI